MSLARTGSHDFSQPITDKGGGEITLNPIRFTPEADGIPLSHMGYTRMGHLKKRVSVRKEKGDNGCCVGSWHSVTLSMFLGAENSNRL